VPCHRSSYGALIFIGLGKVSEDSSPRIQSFDTNDGFREWDHDCYGMASETSTWSQALYQLESISHIGTRFVENTSREARRHPPLDPEHAPSIALLGGWISVQLCRSRSSYSVTGLNSRYTQCCKLTTETP
jgi:hypothetical protein